MLHYPEAQDLLKMCTRAIHGTEWWDILYSNTSVEDEQWAEKQTNRFMLTYAKAVVAEMGIEQAEEYLSLKDWNAAVKELAAAKDLNDAIK